MRRLYNGTVSMITDESLARDLQNGATLALDSNALFGSKLLRLADLVNNLNAESNLKVRLVIPALVHGEHLVQERERLGEGFRLEIAQQALESKGVDVFPYEQQDAEEYSRLLCGRFPSGEARHQARWDRLGLSGGSGRCPATTDWPIALQAESRGWICVTADKGLEFRGTERRANPDQVIRVIESLRQVS